MRRLWLLFAVLLVLGLASCSSDSTGPGTTSAGMTFKANGVSWTSNSISKSGFGLEAYVVGSAENNGITEILGLQLDTVTTGRVIQVGSDSVSFSASSASFSRSDGTWKTRNGSGSVTITEVANGRVKGTFTFTLYKGGAAGADSLKITEGNFNALF
jgi:hypothetical protein